MSIFRRPLQTVDEVSVKGYHDITSESVTESHWQEGIGHVTIEWSHVAAII